MRILDDLKWRYATKLFDKEKKVTESDLNSILEAVRYSASSYGLQLYKVLVVENPELREKLRTVSWNQPQITDASQLIVFCNYADVKEEHINEYLQRIASTRGIAVADLNGYGDMMKSALLSRPADALANWTARQTYIGLGTLLAASAELKIDACPMEGFDVEQYNEILGLKEQGLSAAVIATIGYRSDKDELQHAAKVRRPFTDMFQRI